MYMSPGLCKQYAYERQRDLLAQASRQRLAREVRNATLAARRNERAQRRTVRLLRRARPAVSPS
jgi:hypothetical protein